MKFIVIIAFIFTIVLGIVARPTYEETKITILLHDNSPERKGRDIAVKAPKPTTTPARQRALILPSQQEVAKKVREVFTEEPEVALAVFRAESGLRPNAQGWNCRYNGVSKACLPQDRANAWSVDCGVAQINTPGNTCPEHLYDVETNLAEARKKYVRRGWQPWVAHNQGKHLTFLQ